MRLVDAVTNYITSGCVPIYTVQKQSFLKLLAALDSKFKCPSRNYFTQTAIPDKYASLKASVSLNLKEIPFISITTDGWTSAAKDPYLSLTAHYITKDWELRANCLSTMFTPESHTAENIQHFIRDGLNEFGLTTDRVIAASTDSAANMVKACADMKLARIPCFGHLLHNAINKQLDDYPCVTQLLKDVRKIVSIFSYSFQKRSQLLVVQKELDLPQKQLINDVATRWGSKLAMLKRLAPQLPAIDQLFVNGKYFADHILSCRSAYVCYYYY